MINILKGFGLLLCGIIPQGLQDLIWDFFAILWGVAKSLVVFLLYLLNLLMLICLVCGFVYSIFVAPLIVIAICAVLIVFKVVFR